MVPILTQLNSPCRLSRCSFGNSTSRQAARCISWGILPGLLLRCNLTLTLLQAGTTCPTASSLVAASWLLLLVREPSARNVAAANFATISNCYKNFPLYDSFRSSKSSISTRIPTRTTSTRTKALRFHIPYVWPPSASSSPSPTPFPLSLLGALSSAIYVKRSSLRPTRAWRARKCESG